MPGSPQRLTSAFRRWFREQSAQHGFLATFRHSLALLGEFLRDSLPSRRRQRYGDVDFDWDHRVDTTAATVGWRDRLLGLLHSPYQPTDPALFHEMLATLKIDFRDYVFIDIGSGKGRVLLLAADYPFKRVIGIELLPELNRAAEQNISHYKNSSQQCFSIETHCADAREFVFLPDPLVIYLFNPLPEAGLSQLVTNLEHALQEHSRPLFVLYHNPLLEHVLRASEYLKKIDGTHQYSIFAAAPPSETG